MVSKNQEVSIRVGGVEVLGLITYRSEADITIKINSPYQGLTGGLHIPYFSRPFNSFLSSYGDSTAKHLLQNLYELGHFLKENRDFLRLQSAVCFDGKDYSDHQCQNEFFDKCFPFGIPIGTRNEVLEILR